MEEVFDKDILEVLGDTRRFWRICIFTNIGILSHAVQRHINDHSKLEELVEVAYESRTAGCLVDLLTSRAFERVAQQ